MMQVMKIAPCAVCVMVSGVLSGCAGTTTTQAAFPEPDNAYFRPGTLESPEAVMAIEPGDGRDRVRELLGTPHFSAGFAEERAWHYLFDLEARGDHEPMRCQYRLAFDSEGRVERADWRSARCKLRFSNWQAEPIEGKGVVQNYRLPLESSFTEDGELTAEGRRLLEEFTRLLKRDFRSPSLAVASYPEAATHSERRRSVQAFLSSAYEPGTADITLTDSGVSPCDAVERVSRCERMAQLVIQVRGR
ncbi:outer membrane protein assembly factor BamE [Halomonas sabkhae]|uniref:outer membrane protein assembly factor BamE n=1 Tax=Halomonas sabkhae TaxID=626223 RepID=UPI0025B51C90|nr:outer membrane protein assembly factor BamE [Halomonas sabkhae]MDN3524561.1 outer membrane protein assembly factor BamE [Halomonas sabkhae]